MNQTRMFAAQAPTQKKIQPAEGLKPSIYRLRSGCLATWPYRLEYLYTPVCLYLIHIRLLNDGPSSESSSHLKCSETIHFDFRHLILRARIQLATFCVYTRRHNRKYIVSHLNHEAPDQKSGVLSIEPPARSATYGGWSDEPIAMLERCTKRIIRSHWNVDNVSLCFLMIPILSPSSRWPARVCSPLLGDQSLVVGVACFLAGGLGFTAPIYHQGVPREKPGTRNNRQQATTDPTRGGHGTRSPRKQTEHTRLQLYPTKTSQIRC
jgi:hypothetical protein